MKFLLSLLLFLIYNYSNAQDISKIYSGKKYKFNYGTLLTQCNQVGIPSNPTKTIIANQGWEIKVDQAVKSKGVVVVHFIKWIENPELPFLKQRNEDIVYKNTQMLDANGVAINFSNGTPKVKSERIYFSIPIAEFFDSLELVPSDISVSFGSATIPIKIRPGNGENIPLDFYGNFNAGVGISYTFKNLKNLSFYSGISITSVPVDSLTTSGIITSPTNAAALTPTIGIIKEIGSNVQIGGFIGFDFLSRNLGKNWIYQGRRWFGIGVGVNIFKISSGASNSSDQGG